MRLVASLTVVALLLVGLPAPASAQDTSDSGTDALGNTDDVGSGAVQQPQTPQELMNTGAATMPPGPPTLVVGAPAPVDSDTVLLGPVLHAEGNLALIQLDNKRRVVELPGGALPMAGIPAGSLLEAWGPATSDDVFAASGASLWLPTSP